MAKKTVAKKAVKVETEEDILLKVLKYYFKKRKKATGSLRHDYNLEIKQTIRSLRQVRFEIANGIHY